jgi:hypothetical protein
MRERANWLKSQSLIGKRNLYRWPLKTSSSFVQLARRLPRTPTKLEDRAFQIANHSLVAVNAKLVTCAKENKIAHIA